MGEMIWVPKLFEDSRKVLSSLSGGHMFSLCIQLGSYQPFYLVGKRNFNGSSNFTSLHF